MKNNTFTPAAIKVSPSATVNFTNSDGYNHNLIFDNAAITGSAAFSTGTKSVVMPATAGTYAYHCGLHAGMAGTVQVQ
jgi:plastocyanin